MKIRTGFVSNSSTTSFCIYGAVINENTMLESLKKLVEDGVIKNESVKTMIKDDSFDVYEMEKVFEEHEVDLNIYHDYDSCMIYLGKSPTSLKDNETGKEFKTSIENCIKNIIKSKNLEYKWYAEEIQS